MKYLKRFCLLLILIISLAFFSSCSIISRLGFDTGSSTKTITSNDVSTTPVIISSDISTTTSTTISSSSTTVVTTTTPLDEDDLVTELDYGYGYDLKKYDNYKDLQDLYLVIKDKIDKFTLSTEDVTSQVVRIDDVDSEYYFFDSIDFLKYNIESNMALMVLKNVLLDHPEYYFMDNSFITSLSKTDDVITSQNIKLSINKDYALGAKRIEYNQKIKEFEDDCFKDFTTETTNKEKIKHIHDYILSKAEYALDEHNKPEESSYAHNIIGIIANGRGVCESYAELFTYLLKKCGISALTVSGLGFTSDEKHGGAHAWNYVYIDSKYYGFDVTWNDTAHTNHYYGMSNTELINITNTNEVINNNQEASFLNPLYGGHLASGSNFENGINYLYQLPEVSSVPLITL